MKTYDTAVVQMLELLKSRGVCKYSINAHKSCYDELQCYLATENKHFNLENARIWLKEIILKNNSRNLFWVRWHYIDQLNEFISTGTVIQDHLLLTKSCYDKIYGELKNQLNEYLESRKKDYSPRSFEIAKIQCSEFVLFLQEIGVKSFEVVKPEHVILYYEKEVIVTKKEWYLLISQARQLLEYMVDSLKISPALPLILDENIYKYVADKVLFTKEVLKTIRNSSERNAVCTAGEAFDCVNSFVKEFEDAKYCETIKHNAGHIIKTMYTFLEINQLDYSPDMVLRWFEIIRDKTGASYRAWIRVLNLFEIYIKKEQLNFTKKYTFAPSRIKNYPLWCVKAIGEYSEWLIKSFHSENTCRTYKYSIYTLCEYLIDTGVSNFNELTPRILRDFLNQDYHLTTKGSSSRYTVLRQFIAFLEDNGFIENKTLHNVFPYKMAHSTKIINVLTDEQVLSIDDFRKNCSEPVSLRDAAMVMIGLKLGFRASDVINLRFSSIDWKNKKVSIIQYKTKVPIELPLGVDVGNALYRYIKYGRPKHESDYVFIRHKAPYEPLTGKVCVNALNRILSEYGYDKVHGFHILRKTFATRILRNNSGIEMVIDALGHQDNTTVDKYLTFDEEHMKKCPLSLKELSIEIGGMS